VVAAAEGGPAEWIDDGVNGMLVPPRDVDALGDALQRLVDDRALRARLAQSASRTEGLEDDAVIAEAHRRVFERAARRLRAAEQDPHVLRIAHHAPSSAWRERERALRRLGVDVALISSKKWDVGGTTVTLDASGDSFVSGATTLGTHPSLFVFHPLALWRALGRRPDLIDLHEEPNALVTAEVLILRWLRRIRAPYVLYSAQNIDKRYPLPFRMIERLSLRGAAGAYVCNQEAAAILNRKGLRVPATYIPLGVDIDAFTPAERDLPEEVTVVGYVGRLERHKGVHVLLEAIALHPSRRLTVVGDGPQRRALADLAASLGLTDRVEFVGHASGEQLSALYRTFDVLAVPSLPTQTWREQFGRVAVEAMSAGVPVVASSSGALPDVVGGVGILVPPDDPRGLAGGLDDALEPSRWSALRRDGLRRAQDFSWDRIARDQKALYERALRPDEAGARGLRAIVVAYGDPANLDGCLEALDAAVQVTVVDNSGLAETEAVARRHGAVYIDAEANLGFAGGVNLALAQLDPAALVDVVLVNPDARATPGTLAKMRDALDADRRIAAVGVRQTNPDTGAAMRVWWPFPSPAGAWLEAAGLGRLNRRKGFAVGSVLLLRAEALRDVGPFDESFFLYAEETDWQRRARSRGWRITVADADATHEGGATSSDPSVREGHFYASQQLYIRKHFGTGGLRSYRLANLFGASVRAAILLGPRRVAARRKAELFRVGAVSTETLPPEGPEESR
jgi:glycosyltransferase involved in cell wall biosynthesis/GT2 family glycosyltransferase